MSDTIKVETIKIQIGRKTLELTPEELRELRDVLDATFPKPKKESVMPYYPVIIHEPSPRPWKYWEVTCDAKSHSATLCCSRS